MKNKLKVIISIFISILMIGCLGCGSSSKTSKDTEKQEKIELTISAAASLQESMTDINKLFTKKYSNVKLSFNYGSSGALQQQIEQGAPADVFISAGASQMKALEDEGLLLDKTNKKLVNNSLILVGPKDTTITSLNDLSSDYVTHIAIGDPDSVPAGKYAKETLTNSNLFDSLQDKFVYAKDVKEVLSWATTGNAEVGFVYLSDAISSDTAKVIEEVPEDLHSPIIYPVAVIKATENQDMAKKFEDFLFSDEAKEIFEKYGYTMAE